MPRRPQACHNAKLHATQPTVVDGQNPLLRQFVSLTVALLALLSTDSDLLPNHPLRCLGQMEPSRERCASCVFGRADVSGKDDWDNAAGRASLRATQLVRTWEVEALVARSAAIRVLQVPWASALPVGECASGDSSSQETPLAEKLRFPGNSCNAGLPVRAPGTGTESALKGLQSGKLPERNGRDGQI
jgi:hypothetical protein